LLVSGNFSVSASSHPDFVLNENMTEHLNNNLVLFARYNLYLYVAYERQLEQYLLNFKSVPFTYPIS
jgi:hypothetical protein